MKLHKYTVVPCMHSLNRPIRFLVKLSLTSWFTLSCLLDKLLICLLLSAAGGH